MKKIFGVGMILLLFSRYCFADPISSGLIAAKIDIQTLMQKAHQAVVENQWVKNIQILNQNYQESKRFYDTVNNMSRHRGGLIGYMQDRLADDIDEISADEYSRMKDYLQTSPDDTAYVKNWMNKADKKVYEAIDVSQKINDWGKDRDKEIDDLKKKANNPAGIDSKDYDTLVLSAELKQLELLSATNKLLLRMLKEQQEQYAANWAYIRQGEIEQAKQREKIEQAYKTADETRNQRRKNPFEVLRELPR